MRLCFSIVGKSEEFPGAVEIDIMAGTGIEGAMHQLVKYVNMVGTPVVGKFNNYSFLIMEDADPDKIVEDFMEDCQRRREEYEASDEYKEYMKKVEEENRIVEKAEKEGILPFDCIDEDGWNESLSNNQDLYGMCGHRYAARWANYMEKAMAEGSKLEDIAEQTSYDADLEGITGFMYGCAVDILSHVWVHGEALRR